MALIKVIDLMTGVAVEIDTEQSDVKSEVQPERKSGKASKKAPVNTQPESTDGLL